MVVDIVVHVIIAKRYDIFMFADKKKPLKKALNCMDDLLYRNNNIKVNEKVTNDVKVDKNNGRIQILKPEKLMRLVDSVI